MAALFPVMVLNIDMEGNLPPRHRGEAVLDPRQVAAHEGEEIGRLGERVVPGGKMPAVLQVPAPDRVAVRQEHGIFLLIGNDRGHEARQHVGPVRVEGDLPKALRLALGTEHAACMIEAGKLGVGGWITLGIDLEHEPVGDRQDRERLALDLIMLFVELLAVQLYAEQLQVLAKEHERMDAFTPVVAADYGEKRLDRCSRFVEVELQIDGLDAVVRRTVVLEVGGPGGAGRFKMGHVFASLKMGWSESLPGCYYSRTSSSVKRKIVTLMYPFMLKKAMLSFERSSSLTRECSYTINPSAIRTPRR